MPRLILGLRLAALVEILGFFLMMWLLAYYLGTNLNFWTVSPHPFWIVVILIATQYGTNEGLLAAAVATVVLLTGPLPPMNVLEDRFEHFMVLAKTPILWFAAATLLGELRLRQIRENQGLKEANFVAIEREKQVADAYTALKMLKERLEMLVASEMSTALTAIAAFRELE